ncbi:hypothetical protein ABZ478_26065 [Streptomyces sp. NPDC005706]
MSRTHPEGHPDGRTTVVLITHDRRDELLRTSPASGGSPSGPG